MRNGNFLKMRVSEIRVKQICVNQGLGVLCSNLLVRLCFNEKFECVEKKIDKKNFSQYVQQSFFLLFGEFLKVS